MIWTACKYAPVELLAGFGEETQRLDPSPESFSCADACAHPNLCSFAKALIEEVHEKGIRELVLTDCCDSTRRAYGVLKKQEGIDFIWLLPLPHKNGPAEVRLFAEDLKKLTEAYEKYSGKTLDLTRAVQAYREQRTHAPVMPKGKYVLIKGAHGGKRLVEDVRKTFGSVPVVNDTCSGNRYLRAEAGEEKNFFAWYAEALLDQEKPCMRMWRYGGRNDMDHQPAGMIFHTIKFCDYYGFEYVLEKKNTAGPLLKIESDTTAQAEGQLKTRLEAFREELGIQKDTVMKIHTEGPVYVAGIDSGSASTDAVIMDENRNILGRSVVPTGAGAQSGAEKALQEALQEAGIERKALSHVVTTGYGRESIGVHARVVTEITCHAKGANFLSPSARTVIDIGGQDSKVIRIDEKGNVQNFIMNDKCAAGTGRFLEMQAGAMELSMEKMAEEGLKWKNEVKISSMCTVFAESEVVSLVAKNVPSADIIHGLNEAIARKTSSLVKRMGGEPAYIMTGGVAQNRGVVDCLEKELGSSIFVSPDAQVCGAIGACLIALDDLKK